VEESVERREQMNFGRSCWMKPFVHTSASDKKQEQPTEEWKRIEGFRRGSFVLSRIKTIHG
jgi:hypothetical protein